jgi:subtilisin family serine protease
VQSTASGTTLWTRGLAGKDELIGIIDTHIDLKSCFFSDKNHATAGVDHRKVIYYDELTNIIGSENHGNHIASTLAGDEEDYPAQNTERGIAYEARLAWADFDYIKDNHIVRPPKTVLQALSGFPPDVHIHNASWGDDTHGGYTTLSSDLDGWLFDNEDYVFVEASTNGNVSVKSAEDAKNVLSVNSSLAPPDHDGEFSDGVFGPTPDGRIKPDLIAPGYQTISANLATNTNTCLTTAASGTSMAAPVVTAAAALTHEYYVDGYWSAGILDMSRSFPPTGALIRATLLNATVDATGIAGYPSNTEGWGKVVLDNALFFQNDMRTIWFRDVRHCHGFQQRNDSATYQVTVASGEPLRITLDWTDPAPGPSQPATPKLVNDLDLIVTDPSGNQYLGNHFTNGESAMGGSADRLNNVEMVLLSAPAAGQWTIVVRAQTILATGSYAGQGYALVVTGAVQGTPFIFTPCS